MRHSRDDRAPEHATAKNSALAPVALGLWLLSAGVFVGMVHALDPAFAAVFAELEVELPALTLALVGLRESLHTTSGLLTAAAVVLATAVPFVLGARGPTGAKLYGALFVLSVLATGSIWLAVRQPIQRLAEQLNEPVPLPW